MPQVKLEEEVAELSLQLKAAANSVDDGAEQLREVLLSITSIYFHLDSASYHTQRIFNQRCPCRPKPLQLKGEDRPLKLKG